MLSDKVNLKITNLVRICTYKVDTEMNKTKLVKIYTYDSASS